MNTAPDRTISTAIAATGPTKAAEAPPIKLHGVSIDHPYRVVHCAIDSNRASNTSRFQIGAAAKPKTFARRRAAS
jgi:hypothetical protein